MKLNHYETTIILQPKLSKTEVKSTIDHYKKILKEEQVTIIEETIPMLKNLAYPIQKQVSGLYYIIQYNATNTSLLEKIEREFRIDEKVMRFLTIKLDKHALAYYKNKKETEEKNKDSHQTETTEEIEGKETTQTEKSPSYNTKKYCRFKKFNIKYIDYKEQNFLLKFLNPQGKILPRRLSGNSAKAQRMVNRAVKRGRQMAYLPFVADNLK